MRTVKRVLIVLVILVVCFVGLVMTLIISSGIPSTGKKIEKYSQPKRALIVIDVQEDFTGTTARSSSPYGDSGLKIEAINKAVRYAVKSGMPVVYIRHEFEGPVTTVLIRLLMGGVALKGSPGTAIDKRVEVVSQNIFTKGKGDAFSNPELDAFMIKSRISELYLTGLDAEYCVHATAKGALNRGYKVNIITDAILLGAKKKWDKIISEYKGEGIGLLTVKEFR